MTEEQIDRLADHRCPDCDVDLDFEMPVSAGMGKYGCPECGQTFHLASEGKQ